MLYFFHRAGESFRSSDRSLFSVGSPTDRTEDIVVDDSAVEFGVLKTRGLIECVCLPWNRIVLL